MATDMLSYHFKRVAQEMGYEDCKVFFSLGFCQGDHVHLEGSPEMEPLADRLLAGKHIPAAKRAVEKGFSVEIRNGSVWDTRAIEDLTPLEEEAEQQFFEAIVEDVKDLQRDLMHEGHDLLLNLPSHEGEVLKEFSTVNFTLKVILEQEEDGLWDESGEEDYDWANILDLIHGHLHYGRIKVVVLENEYDEEIGSAFLGGCWLHPKHPRKSIRGSLLEKVQEAIEEARANAGLIKKPKLAKAA